MCGLIYCKNYGPKPVFKNIRKQYFKQHHRGTNGFGFIEIAPDKVGAIHRTRTEHEILRQLSQSKANEVMFHHRIPTSTPNIPESNHPIPVSHESLQYDYIGIHNGMIRNTWELEKKYRALGFPFTTAVATVYKAGKNTYETDKAEAYNDSEFLMIDLARAIESNSKKLDSEGSIAFIIMQMEKETRKPVKLFFGRNSINPLNINVTDAMFSLSSEGYGVEVAEHKLHWYDYVTGDFMTRTEGLEIGTDYKNWNKKNSHTHGAGYHSPVASVNKTISTPSRLSIDKDDPLADTLILPATRVKTNLPIRVEDPDDENFGNFIIGKVIPNHPEGLKLKLSKGEVTYMFCQEVEFDYIQICEQIEFLKDTRKNSFRDLVKFAQCNSLLDIHESDQKILQNAIKKNLPDLFSDYKLPIVPVRAAEPIVYPTLNRSRTK